MGESMLYPDYIFESSWEVCNKVGGIYTVLSTRAKTLQDAMKDRIIFIGPDCRDDFAKPFFDEDAGLFADWKAHAERNGINLRVGRWRVPGLPVTVLVDFRTYYEDKDHIYGKLWEDFQVDSLHAYGDYDEASMFSYAAARVVESFYSYFALEDKKVIYHGNEWMTGLGILYIRKFLPEVATIFTTHATSIGRSIAGNNKPLYQYFEKYNGDQMAVELNMQSKQSIEKQTAKFVDCFTTVSDITAAECKQLLDKPVDAVLPNGFENDFVPTGNNFTSKRRSARKSLLKLANALTGEKYDDETLLVSTSGRYEFRNKGIDVFIEAMNRLRFSHDIHRKTVAFLFVPAGIKGPRQDLAERLKTDRIYGSPLDNPRFTHEFYNLQDDMVLGMMDSLDIQNKQGDPVKIIFINSYLLGDDGILNKAYYDLILGSDLCIYPSYYEPWGYTPLESVAFKVPCITTDLAGFGLWVNSIKGFYSELEDGVKVIHRTDYNYSEVADMIKLTVEEFAAMTPLQVRKCRMNAEKISRRALWSNFIVYYQKAYDFALRALEKRTKN